MLGAAADAVAAALGGLDDWGPAGTRPGQYRSDIAADEAAVAILSDAGFGVLSEESGLHDAERPLLAVVDPLDGSTNAARGLPWFATSICVLDSDGPLAAVVVNQANGVRYDAIRAGGARRDGRPIPRRRPRRSVGRSCACPGIRRAISVGASTGRSAPPPSTSAPSPRGLSTPTSTASTARTVHGTTWAGTSSVSRRGRTSSTPSAMSSSCAPTAKGARPSRLHRAASSGTARRPRPGRPCRSRPAAAGPVGAPDAPATPRGSAAARPLAGAGSPTRPAGTAAEPVLRPGSLLFPMTADSPLELLMEVQQNDIELDQLLHRRANLPERTELKAVEARLASPGERAAQMRSERGALADRETSLESEIESLTLTHLPIENRLFHGDATAFRDQQAMAEEVKSLEHRRRGLEDRDLELMEEAETADPV